MAGNAALDHADRMQEGELVGILIGLESRFVHQVADGKVGHEQALELLFNQLWRLAAQYI